MATKSNDDQKKQDGQSFEDIYKKLQGIEDSTQAPQQQDLLTSFAKQCGNMFDFKQYKFVTQDNNNKIFTQLSKSLSQYKENYDLQTAIFQTIRILSRSKTGINALMAEQVKLPLHYLISLHIK